MWNFRNIAIMAGVGAVSAVLIKAAQWAIGDIKAVIG